MDASPRIGPAAKLGIHGYSVMRHEREGRTC